MYTDLTDTMTWDDLPACTACLTKEKRIQAAEAALYGWACGHFQQQHVKQYCLTLGFVIDFRQADTAYWKRIQHASDLHTHTQTERQKCIPTL
mgnify:CR=1 FL=1